MKTELQIDLSPLTGRIYIGRAMPGSDHWYGDHRDVTERAIHLVALHILDKFAGVMTLTVSAGTENREAFEIEVKRRKLAKSIREIRRKAEK